MINSDSLKEFVENNPDLVSLKETSNPDLFVLKYKNKCFYKNIWNEFLENSRGTILDKDYNIISLPFTKIYNYGIEDNAPKLSDDTILNVFRKINGFMVSITWYNNNLLISTTGSIDSDYVQYAKDMIGKNLLNFKDILSEFPNHTFLFECVHPDDPHIIKETPGMYLLGFREKIWNSRMDFFGENVTSILGTQPVEQYQFTLKHLKDKAKVVEHEGFVAYTHCGVSFKIKSPYYLILKALARKQNILSLDKTKVDEEYYPLLSHIHTDIDYFTSLSEQDRLTYIREFIWNTNY